MISFMLINLYNPTVVGVSSALIIAFLLGIVHGITPDEHTWPITFSYAIGSYSTKKGAKAGLLFSAGFTVQRAILAELAYLALAPFLLSNNIDGAIYIVVGIVMALSGFYILKKGIYIHWHSLANLTCRFFHICMGMHDKDIYEKEGLESHDMFAEHKVLEPRAVPLKLTFVHGLIAGFGFGAFALILYTVIVPQMPNAWVAWIPGMLFGIGTMVMQVIFGALMGFWLKTRKYAENQIAYIAKKTSGRMLAYGGIVFAIAGIILILFPQLYNYNIITPLKIHNLHSLGIGFILVIAVVGIISIPSYLYAVKESKKLKPDKYK
ncbi:MAG: hypothetical protein ACP5RF_02085 [Candidatus Micrarchaeia archaeon]